MDLSFTQLSAITRGADHTYINDTTGRFVMRRCTDTQTTAYGKEFGPKCEMSAGIRFDFWTDAQTIAFDYTITRRASVLWMSIDLYADGVMVAADYKNTHQTFDTYTFAYRFEMPARRHITIYLPYMVDVQVHRFTVDDGAEITPFDNYAGRMLCFGDSITHGYLAHYSSCTYPASVARYFGFDFNNQGNAGYVFDGATIDPELHFAPNLITVAFGTNDWSKLPSNEELVCRAQGFFDRLSEVYPGIPVFSVLPLWRSDCWRPKKAGGFDQVRQQLADIMDAHDCIIIDGAAAVPHVPEFYDDYRLHPNDLGFAFYTQAMIAAISNGLR